MIPPLESSTITSYCWVPRVELTQSEYSIAIHDSLTKVAALYQVVSWQSDVRPPWVGVGLEGSNVAEVIVCAAVVVVGRATGVPLTPTQT